MLNIFELEQLQNQFSYGMDFNTALKTVQSLATDFLVTIPTNEEAGRIIIGNEWSTCLVLEFDGNDLLAVIDIDDLD